MRFFFKKRLPYRVSRVSWFWVSLQFITILYLSISAPLLANHLTGLILELSGILIVMAGLIKLNWSSFSVFPEPRPDGKLETTGIYAIIRHPMYAGVLLISFILVAEFPSTIRILSLTILTSVIILKIMKEESFLSEKYQKEYDAWKQNTNRLIPFIW